MNPVELFIGVPVYKTEHPAHRAAREVTLAYFGGRAVYHRQVGDSSLARARAALLGAFLQYEREWTHFLQTDDDQSWDPRHLEYLCNLNLPVVGLPCAFKSDVAPHAGFSTIRGLAGEVARPEDHTCKVKYLGGGFILWRRDVIDNLCFWNSDDAFDTNNGAAKPQATYNLWRGGVVNREYLSEDYWACHLASELGYELRAYLGACSPHWLGERAYVPAGYDPVGPVWKAAA